MSKQKGSKGRKKVKTHTRMFKHYVDSSIQENEKKE